MNHVATIRNARGGKHPSPIKAAEIAEKAGADSIVVHLREDRRHIKEQDIQYIIKNIKMPLQLEIAPTKFILQFYKFSNNIKKCVLYLRKRKELTTEGGLNLVKILNFYLQIYLN